jgi:MraZ protein
VPDKQGRFTIPANLRQYAGLDRDVTVIGAGTRLEVWDSAVWDAYLEQNEQSFAETAQEIVPGVF